MKKFRSSGNQAIQEGMNLKSGDALYAAKKFNGKYYLSHVGTKIVLMAAYSYYSRLFSEYGIKRFIRASKSQTY